MTTLRSLLVPVLLALGLAACSGGGGTSTGVSAITPAPLSGPFVEEGTGRTLASDLDGSLNSLASGASAGTLLARSADGRTCIFANGREGWNRAAC